MSPIRLFDIRFTRIDAVRGSLRPEAGWGLAVTAGSPARADRKAMDMAQGVRTG